MDSSRSFERSPSTARSGAFHFGRGHSRDFSNDLAVTQLAAHTNTQNNAASLLAGLPALTLQVSVRDVTLTLEVGAGLQSCKWLATVAASQYAATQPSLSGDASFLPVHLTDTRGNVLYPSDLLCEVVEQGDTLRLELIGPRLGLTSPDFVRERSLWELYAYASSQPAALVPLVFLFDASELSLSTPPALFGNFNNWGVPIHMNFWTGSIYKHQMEFPAGSELVFKFVVGGSSILTPQVYPIVHDSQGNKMHYIKVSAMPPNASMDALYAPPLGVSTGGVSATHPVPLLQAAQAQEALDLSDVGRKKVLTLRAIIDMNQRAQATFLAEQKLRRNGTELPVLSARIVGAFPAAHATRVPKVNSKENARRLARDWHQLTRSIGDILPAQAAVAAGPGARAAAQLAAHGPAYPERMAALRSVLSKYHGELSSIFSYYAQGTAGCSPRGQTWNLISWLSFLALVRVADQRATTARLDRIFYLVLAKRDPSSGGAAAGGNGAAGGIGGGVAMGQAELKSANNSLGKVLLHKEDPFSPLNALTRADFVEALLRAAMLKFKNPRALADWMPEGAAAAPAPAGSAGSAEEKKDGGVTGLNLSGLTLSNSNKSDAKKAGGSGAAPPPQLKEPNPALSLELLLKLHILPFAASSGVSNSGGGGAASMASLPAPASFNPAELRARLLLDQNVQQNMARHSAELHRLFRHYTAGPGASGLGIGLGAAAAGMPGAATHLGIVGGANGANIQSLPPTLLGQSFAAGPAGLLPALLPGGGAAHTGRGGSGQGTAHNANGSLRSSVGAPIASATMQLRELEALLLDYELLDPLIPKARALASLGIVLEGAGADDPAGAPALPAGSSLLGGPLGSLSNEGDEHSFELVYPEFLELLVRIAAVGHRWSNLYLQQQKVIAAALANGSLSPLDKPPASLFLSAGVSPAGLVEEEAEESEMAGARRADHTELCERFTRLMRALFPSEAEQRERRAKMAAQATASAVPVAAPAAAAAAAAPAADKKDEKGAESAKGGAKGKAGSRAVSAPKTPAKKAPAAKK